MDVLGQFISPPKADHILVAKWVVILLSLLFVPYISVIFGNVVYAFAFSLRGMSEKNQRFMRFSQHIMDRMLGRTGPPIVLGILPLLTMSICYAQMLYGTDSRTSVYFFVTMGLTALAIMTAYVYKGTFETRESKQLWHYAMGGLTLAVFSLAIYSYVSAVTILTFPQKWPLHSDSLLPFPWDWNLMARFVHFMIFAKAIAAAAILFFFFTWERGKEQRSMEDSEYRAYVKKFAAGACLAFSILSTLFFLWYMATLPNMAKSSSVYFMAIAAIAVLLIASLLLNQSLNNAKTSYGTPIFMMFMLFTLFLLVTETTARNNALVYQNYALAKISEDRLAEIESIRIARESGGGPSFAEGEALYNNQCFACHKFEGKGIGPAYDDVLSKYVNDQNKLKEFILNPTAINPGEFPGGMPNQGLSPGQAESAAIYLLEKYNETKNK